MYKLFAKYANFAWEEIDTANSKEEAFYLLKEYMFAFGNGWSYKIKATRNKKPKMKED